MFFYRGMSLTLVRVLCIEAILFIVEAFLGLENPQCVVTTKMTSREVVVTAEGLTFGVTSKTITKSAHGACFQRRDSVYEPRYVVDNKCATIKRLWYRYCRVYARG